MKVRELREALDGVDPDLEVVCPSSGYGFHVPQGGAQVLCVGESYFRYDGAFGRAIGTFVEPPGMCSTEIEEGTERLVFAIGESCR